MIAAASLWVLACSAEPSSAKAEERAERADCPEGHTLRYQVGFGVDQVREELLVSYRFVGPAISFGGGYSFARPAWCLDTYLGVGWSAVWNSYRDPGVVVSPTWGAGFRASVFTSESLILDLGPALNTRINNSFLHSWDDARTYWFSSLTFDAEARMTWWASAKNALTLRLGLPLFGWVGRSEDERLEKQEEAITFSNLFGRPLEDLEFASWGSFAAFELGAGVAWRMRAPGRLELATRYDLHHDGLSFRRLQFMLSWTQWFHVGRRP